MNGFLLITRLCLSNFFHIDITKYSSNSFIYEWQDDSSYVGHATQTYINEPFDLVVIDDTLIVRLSGRIWNILSNER